MNQPTTDSSDALGGAHDELLEDLRTLRNVAQTEPFQQLLSRLIQTRHDLIEHFQFEEQNGYLDSVRKRDLCLDHTLTKLAGEHRSLLRSLDDILAQCQTPHPAQDNIRKRVQDWVHEVRGHEIRENDLIQDAFTHDLGIGD